jgi:hypothetical protein
MPSPHYIPVMKLFRVFPPLPATIMPADVAVPSAIQRFPPELAYPIILSLLTDQLQAIAFGSRDSDGSEPAIDDAYPTLSLLHLCAVFRRCTLEVLRHMAGMHDGRDNRCATAFYAAPCIRFT